MQETSQHLQELLTGLDGLRLGLAPIELCISMTNMCRTIMAKGCEPAHIHEEAIPFCT